MVKSVKGQKKFRNKRSSKKLFKINEDTAKGVGLGVLAAAGVLSLGYAGVLAPIIKKNRLKAQEDREAAEISTTVERRMIERRDSAKNKALKAFEDLKALGNSVLTSPRPSVGQTISTTPVSPGPSRVSTGSPKMSVAPKNPGFSVLDSITVVPKSSPVPRASITPKTVDITVVEKRSASNTPLSSMRPNLQQSPSSRKIFSYKGKARKVLNTNVVSGKGVFTDEQKEKITMFILSNQDPASYISSITGLPYTPSKIKFKNSDSMRARLHIIHGAAVGVQDSEILKGLEFIRNQDKAEQEKLLDEIVRAFENEL